MLTAFCTIKCCSDAFRCITVGTCRYFDQRLQVFTLILPDFFQWIWFSVCLIGMSPVSLLQVHQFRINKWPHTNKMCNLVLLSKWKKQTEGPFAVPTQGVWDVRWNIPLYHVEVDADKSIAVHHTVKAELSLHLLRVGTNPCLTYDL